MKSWWTMRDVIRIAPQPGAQTKFAACTSDICIFGGQAFGGKSYALLLEAMKWVKWPKYEAIIFRRQSVDITGSGGLWSEAQSLYRPFGAQFRAGQYLDARWDDTGSVIQFAHLNNEDDVYNFQGKQLAFVGLDELTHFTEKQFWYIWTRLRSMCGIRPYLRATCNPDPDSFVAKLIDWWIGDDGYPIPERDGVLRWFCRRGDELQWFDTAEECQDYLDSVGDHKAKPKSLTFIRSEMQDNAIGMAAQPDYQSQLAAMDLVTRGQLLDGNWRVRARSGGMFDRTWFEIIDALPAESQWAHQARGWDKAATKPNPANEDPDYTRGVKGVWLKNGQLVISDMVGCRAEPGHVDELVLSTAKMDGPSCVQAMWVDPGQSGKVDQFHTDALFRRKAGNLRLVWEQATKNKVEYAKPFSAFCDPTANDGIRRVKLLRGPWNAEFLAELERFPKPAGVAGKGVHDDVIDACSRMWIEVQRGRTGNPNRFMTAMQRARA